MRTSTITGVSGVPMSRASWATLMVSGVAMSVPSSFGGAETRCFGLSLTGRSRSAPCAQNDRGPGRCQRGLATLNVDHLHPAAAVALDPQEPRREGPERLDQRAGGRGQWVVAVA